MPTARDRRLLQCALPLLLGCMLGAFAWPGRRERLIAELRAAEDPHARSDLLLLLGALGDAATHEAVREAARDRDANVRASALRALVELKDVPRAVMRESATGLLSDTAPQVRAAAAEALGALADGAAEEVADLLLRSLADEDPKVRTASARALGKLRADKVISGLGRALSDASLEVARAAARALAAEGGSQASGLLAGKLGQAAPELRLTILDAVTDAPALADKLAHLALADEAPEVVLAGLRLVLRHHLAALRETVEALARAPDPRLAYAAGIAAAELRAPDTDAPRGTQPAQGARPPWLEPLLRAGDPALPAAQVDEVLRALEASLPPGQALAAEPLAEWLLRAPPGPRARIAALLAGTGAAPRADALLKLLSEPDAALQIALCDVLAHTRDARYAQRLMPLLVAGDPALRAAAARALGALADPETVDWLRGWLTDERTREPAALALGLSLARVRGMLSTGAQRRLRRALRAAVLSGDEPSAARAARALGELDAYAANRFLAQHAMELSAARQLALLRAGARDGSPSARALRARYASHGHAPLAATAFSAQVLANERAPHELLQLAAQARWPLGPIAAYGLARSPARKLAALAPKTLCEIAQHGAEPSSRRNLRVALERLQVTCGELPRENALSNALERPLPGAFQALLFEDGSVLISASDAARDASWRELRHVAVADPWQWPYGSPR